MFATNPTAKTFGALLSAATIIVSIALSANAALDLRLIPSPLMWIGLIFVTIGLTVFPVWWYQTMTANRDEFLRSLLVKRFVAASLVMLSLVTPVGIMQHYRLLPAIEWAWFGLAFWLTFFAMYLFIRTSK